LNALFPDKKFQDGEWHPHHQWNSTGDKAARTGQPQLRHHEYQSSKGIPFPPATGNNYTPAAMAYSPLPPPSELKGHCHGSFAVFRLTLC